MDEKCKRCPQICKRLAPGDEPVHYLFRSLSPGQVIAVIQAAVQEYGDKLLRVKESAESSGNQLAILMEAISLPVSANTFDRCMVIVSQAEAKGEGITDMWIRYGPSNLCCSQDNVVTELTEFVKLVLERLFEIDRNLVTHRQNGTSYTERHI